MQYRSPRLHRPSRLALSLALLLPAVGAAADGLDADPARLRQPARFRVADEVVNPNLKPFTATIPAVGNSLQSASFEPATYRTRFFAAADAPDRLVLGASDITQYDSLREGFYDGAEVRVYRIVNGRFTLVRRDRVPEGGSAMSGWTPASSENELVPQPSGGASQVVFRKRFDDWHRPDVPNWFTVTAVDREGRESPHAKAVAVAWTPVKDRAGSAPTPTVAFKPPREIPAGEAPAAPANLRGAFDPADGAAVLEWGAVDGESAGYRVYRSDYAPEAHRGYFLQLAGGTPAEPRAHIRKGDWVVVGKVFDAFSRNRHHSNRVWGSQQNKAAMPDGISVFPDESEDLRWTLVPHEPGSPVKEGGARALKAELKAGATLAFEKYNHAGTGQSWYEVLDPGIDCVVEFWAKQQGMAKPKATFRLNGRYGRKDDRRVEPILFELSGQWTRHRATFRVPDRYEGDGTVGQTSLSFEGPGTVWIDNLRVYAGDASFLDCRPYEYASLKRSGMGMLRTHGFIKTGTSTYTLDALTNPGGVIAGKTEGNTLPQTLAIMDRAGVDPWLQIEPHFSPEEWQGLVEYLAAPYDPAVDTPATKPWAAKRHAQGRAAPWTDAFGTVFFEVGNETWNWLFKPWVFEGMKDGETGREYHRAEVYGLFQEHVIDCLRASPHWKAAGLDDKVEFVLGGWRVQKYGLRAATTSPRSRHVMRAGYNGGWDEGEGPAADNDESLFLALTHPGQSAAPEAAEMRAERDRMRAAGESSRFALGTYEAGPGYALSGLNKQARMTPAQVRAQEETMKSLGVGTATLDTFLARASHGYESQNFFTFRHGRSHWVSHGAWHRGAVAHPPWMTLALFNNEGLGDMLAVEAKTVPTIDLPGYKRRPAIRDMPLVACHATRRGDRLNLFILSRKLDGHPLAGDDGFTPVAVELPLRRAKSLRLYRMTGDPRLHNLDGERVRIERVDLPAAAAGPVFTVDAQTGADARGLPPGATLLYVFEGVE